MNELLTIRKFGPIKRADINVKDLTIFIGPQATGKSLAAQILFFLSGIEETILGPDTSAKTESSTYWAGYSPYIRDEITGITESAFRWWLGEKPTKYTSNKSKVRWQPPSSWRAQVAVDNKSFEIYWDKGKACLSDDLQTRVQGYLVGIDEMAPALPFQQIYIPAGRSLYSNLPPAQALITGRGQDWPGYILMFYSTLDKAIRDVSKAQLDDVNWIEKKNENQELLSSIREQMGAIMKGELHFGTRGDVTLTVKGRSFSPQNFASGQMEIWPFYVTMESQLLAGKLPATRFYLEEPEAHLHPGAQVILMNTIANAVNGGGKVLLTTHSPYILYAVNTLLLANKVLQKGKTLPEEVDPRSALKFEQVAAYKFTNEGSVNNILDRETGLVDEAELDQVADELGARFGYLQDLLHNEGGDL